MTTRNKPFGCLIAVAMMLAAAPAFSASCCPSHAHDTDKKKAAAASPANPATDKAADQTLQSGYYTAKVGAIVCAGCKGLIEKTMMGVPGIGAAQVDIGKGGVTFAVQKGKKVQLSKLEKSLGEAADQMGMGADFTLSEVQPLKNK